METIYIETERLILRSWKNEDRAFFAEMNRNEHVMKYFPKLLSTEESDSFVNRIIAEFEKFGYGLYAVETKDTGDFIGYVGFHRFNFEAPFSPNWEIGWRISDRFWHKGYATEAAQACIKYAQENKLFDRLFSFTAIQNIPSENVMKRIGMTHICSFMHPALPDEHLLKQHQLYSIKL
ncbi:MAG: GNAT family N-acetyltransferase [Muribaculaceae bacterium]|nr:GNAT family N-acetyltransferase [Muribaculaceae bacterium]